MEPTRQTTEAQIDAVLRSYPWMDFELQALRDGVLELHGGVALEATPRPDVVLTFDDVFFIIAPRRWKTDTTQTVLLAHDGADAREPLGLSFDVELGYRIFELRAEDARSSCWIAARSVTLTQHRSPEVPLSLRPDWEGRGGWSPTK